ncbi:MAG: iron-containing alcohol dehydrogenase [Candidatus Helarchaeota archaeon]|nr:iron-containing alcohol dehydrogenase [Candidatus Helarchaeota archaeon]
MSLNMIKIPTIYHGKGCLKELRNFRQERILIVTDTIVWKLFGEKVTKYFKNKEVKVFDEVEPDPKDTTIQKAGEVAREFKPDLIIGLGGGSAMDVAKGVYFLYERVDKTLFDLNPVNYFKLGQKSKLVVIPTTSGTGAENTMGIVVTKTATGQKVPLASTEVTPAVVILDPNLPAGMPPKLTAVTGIDALVHAIEGEINKLNSDFTEAINLHAIKLIFQYLPAAFKKGADDAVAREKMHNAASLAGIGFGNSSCAIGHSCGHALGGAFHLEHGIAVGVMLPYVLEFNKPASEGKYAEILKALNVATDNPTATLAKMVRNLLTEVNIPTNLKPLIAEPEWTKGFEKLVQFAKTDILVGLNPRTTTEADFRKIFQCAYEGRSVDW